jgi:lipoprotein-releasing system permease protein
MGSSMQSASAQSKELLDKIFGFAGHLSITPRESPFTDWEQVANRIAKIDGIRYAAPLVDGSGIVSTRQNANPVFVRGIRSADLSKLASVPIRHGTLEAFDGGHGVAISTEIANNLSLTIGDSITVTARTVTPTGPTYRHKVYKVAAVFESERDRYEYSGSAYGGAPVTVFIPLAEAQTQFNRDGEVTSIQVYTADPNNIDFFRGLVAQAAGRPIDILDWRQQNATFFRTLRSR